MEFSLDILIKDRNMKTIDDNISDKELLEYIYVDLEAGEEYYLEVRNIETIQEAVDLRIEGSTSIIPFMIGILVILAGMIFGIFKIIKKIKIRKK
jgi:hypothetical protein